VSNIPQIPGAAIESFTAVAGTGNIFTTTKKVIAVTHIVATEAFAFNVVRIGPSSVDLIAKKPSAGDYPLRLWFVDWALTDADQLPNTYDVELTDTLGVTTTQSFTRTGLTPIAMPAGTASVNKITSTLGALPWEYRIGPEVHVYAMGIEPSGIMNGDTYPFTGTSRRRLVLGDDYVINEDGTVRVLTNLADLSDVTIDYDYAIRSSLTGW
jgi:hypothetical protein